MFTEFHLNASELDESFIEKVKKLFGNKTISIVIEEEQDETEYLLKNEANKKILLESVKQADNGELVTVKFGKSAGK